MKRIWMILEAALLFFFSIEALMLAMVVVAGFFTAVLGYILLISPEYILPNTFLVFGFLAAFFSLLMVISVFHKLITRWIRMNDQEIKREIQDLWKDAPLMRKKFWFKPLFIF